MDISELDSIVADTGTLHVKDLDGQPMYKDGQPVRIVVHAPGTEAFAAVESRQTSRAVSRMAENDGKPSVPAPDVRKRERAEDLAAITVAFEGLTAGGKQGQELFRAVYSHPKSFFIVEQVEKFLKNLGNFKPVSESN